MKIIFLTHHLKADDGWSRYAKDLAESLNKNGAEILCVVDEKTELSKLPQVAALGPHLSYVANPFIILKTAIRLRKILRDFKPDIVHVIVEPYATILPFVSTGRAKLVLTVHSTFAFMPILVGGFKRTVSTFLTRLIYKRVDTVICVSEFTKNHLLLHMAKIGALENVQDKTFVLAGGVDVQSVAMQNSDVRKNEKVNSNGAARTKEILFVGAIKPRKGLLEAITALQFVQTDFVYRIVGTYKDKDPYVQLLLKNIEEYGLKNKIVFEGRVDDDRLQKLYSTADLFLMLSTNNGADFEGYGLVYIEANAHGVPCIGPKDSGVSEAIVEGQTGFLVDQYDSRSVAEKIDRALLPDTFKKTDCRRWAEENSIDKKARIVSDVYETLLSTKS